MVSGFPDEALRPEAGRSHAHGARARQRWTQDLRASLFKAGASLGLGGWRLSLPIAGDDRVHGERRLPAHRLLMQPLVTQAFPPLGPKPWDSFPAPRRAPALTSVVTPLSSSSERRGME